METFNAADVGYAAHLERIIDFNMVIIDKAVKEMLMAISWSDEVHLWLGHSSDYSVWTLAVVPWNTKGDADDDLWSFCHAVLTDPPRRREQAIVEVLLLASERTVRASGIPKRELRARIASVEFTEYKTAGSYLPCLPEWMHDIPATLELAIGISMGASVSSSWTGQYEVDSIAEAMEIVAKPRLDGVEFAYVLLAQDVVPLLTWDFDCALVREHYMCGSEKRKVTVQGSLPWDNEPNREIMRLYQKARTVAIGMGCYGPDYYGPVATRLRMGGRSSEEARDAYRSCAKELRPIFRAVKKKWRKTV